MDQKPNQTSETPAISQDEQNSILNDLEALVQKDKPNVLKMQQTTPITQTVAQSETTKPLQKEFQSTPLTNTNIQERYKILKVLGEGGMGVVQLAYDQMLQREIALKRIKPKMTSLSKTQQGLLWRFQRETSINAILEHPNIIPLYDAQQQLNGEMFFTMRKIEGKTLREILLDKRENPKKYEEVELLSIFLKVCDAVAYAHSKGVIHRDLKPENIMVGQFGEVYVMDWGIAKVTKKQPQELVESIETKPLEEATADQQNQEEMLDSIETESQEEAYETIGGIGTEGYMAPEQRENASQAFFVADIYSLGKILRECYTLLSPMEEFKLLLEKGSDQLKKTAKKNIENTQVVDKNFSLDIQAIVKKATNENPLERYLKVEDLSKDIQQHQKNKRVSARKYNFIENLFRWLIISHKHSFVFLTFFSLISFFSLSYFFKIEKSKHENLQKEITTFGKAIELTRENTLSSLTLNLRDRNWTVRLLSAINLGNLNEDLEQRILILIRSLIDENGYVRYAASLALMKMAQSSTIVIPKLIQSLKNENKNIQKYLIYTLGDTGEKTVPDLIQAFQEENKTLKINIAKIFRRMGPKAKEAIPILIQNLENKDKDIQLEVAKTLIKIDNNIRTKLDTRFLKLFNNIICLKEFNKNTFTPDSKYGDIIPFIFFIVLLILSSSWIEVKIQNLAIRIRINSSFKPNTDEIKKDMRLIRKCLQFSVTIFFLHIMIGLFTPNYERFFMEYRILFVATNFIFCLNLSSIFFYFVYLASLFFTESSLSSLEPSLWKRLFYLGVLSLFFIIGFFRYFSRDDLFSFLSKIYLFLSP